MQYREFKRTGIKVSEIALGAEHIEHAPYDEVKRIVDLAMDHGVNYTDLFMGSPDVRDHFGKALKGKRDKMMIAGHLGATMSDGQYYVSRDVDYCKTYFYDLLERLQTDYIDVIMLHNIDHMDDLKVVLEGGMLDFCVEMKRKGVARMIGISTHVPQIARTTIETGEMDTVMFSFNPMFDLMPAKMDIYQLFDTQLGDKAAFEPERHELCTYCEQKGVGLVVMKAFAGGILLGDKSPIKMTVNQCIHYALTRPGVATTALGCRTAEEFAQSLEYLHATDEEKAFGQLYGDALNWSGEPRCVYCNHCLPCPQGIDIGDAMRKIDTGGKAPEDCIHCGLCEERCPFGVPIRTIFKNA